MPCRQQQHAPRRLRIGDAQGDDAQRELLMDVQRADVDHRLHEPAELAKHEMELAEGVDGDLAVYRGAPRACASGRRRVRMGARQVPKGSGGQRSSTLSTNV